MSPSPQPIASTNELGVAGRATKGSDETLVNVARSPCRSRRKPSGDRVAGLLAVRPGVLIRRVEPTRTARPRRVPGRIPRTDNKGLHTGPAPVHHLVPHPLPAPVRRPPRRYRRVRRNLEARGRARATVTR